MAKKAVATLRDRTSGKGTVKCIRMVRSKRSGAYIFQEEILPVDKEKEFFEAK
ncbi:MAG: DUF4295 domain-containing protein [Bacteroidales bacterium]|jgi:hypothetical protein|nr:DUF4295 domain-containing protein [Bacteroidales bacterium]HHV39788.1 DUF4295 domain-containing protein [Bacteroidales bacterium]